MPFRFVVGLTLELTKRDGNRRVAYEPRVYVRVDKKGERNTWHVSFLRQAKNDSCPFCSRCRGWSECGGHIVSQRRLRQAVLEGVTFWRPCAQKHREEIKAIDEDINRKVYSQSEMRRKLLELTARSRSKHEEEVDKMKQELHEANIRLIACRHVCEGQSVRRAAAERKVMELQQKYRKWVSPSQVKSRESELRRQVAAQAKEIRDMKQKLDKKVHIAPVIRATKCIECVRDPINDEGMCERCWLKNQL